MRVNSICHQRIQTSEEELQYWILIYRTRYGNYFWYDEEDLEQHKHKQAEHIRAEKEERLKMERVAPIIQLVTTATGRNLKTKERQLITSLSEKDAATFSNLMNDVASSSGVQRNFGYGYFDD